MTALAQPPAYRGYGDGTAELPPRPPLGRLDMGVGFMLWPTKFLDRCRETCGDWFTLKPVPDRTIVVTCDPAAVKQVFQGSPDVFRAGEGNEVLGPLLGPRSVLLLDGAEHMRQRKLLLPPFHGERMRAYGDAMSEVAARHVAAWPARGSLPALPTMQAITLEVIVRTVFGITEPARIDRFSAALRGVLDVIASRPQVVLMGLMGGRLGGPLNPWTRLMKARDAADAVLYEEIAARRAADAQGDDVLSLLLAARDEDGEGLSDRELRDELMTLLVAGHETSATALSWALERATRTPGVLERLYDDPDDDEYLDAVLAETLRLRPVVPAVARRLTEPVQLGPWALPAGVFVGPSIYLLHMREDLYPQPRAFRPERFLGEGRPGTYEWIPFGGGVRRCLGASFALFEMRAVLREVLRGARLRASSKSAESTTRRAITFAPTRGGRVVFS